MPRPGGRIAKRPALSRLHRLLLALPPERAHDTALALLAALERLPGGRRWLARRRPPADRRLATRAMGINFANPLGLAAGFDKDARVIPAMAALGFGWLEVGTVTPVAQAGNPRPRLFRHAAERSLENAMGFNNRGVEALAARLAAAHPAPVPVAVNVGKNRATPIESAEEDYARLFSALAGRCDLFVVNVSSPNTPGLRDLQQPRAVARLVALGRELGGRPIGVKLSPDLDPGRAVELALAAVEAGAAAVVLANTTTEYDLLPGCRGIGGLSGAVVREKSFRMLAAVAPRLFGRCTLISVGGIDSAAEAWRRLRAGASLVELYTALVFAGPELPARLLGELADRLERAGVERLSDIVGAELR